MIYLVVAETAMGKPPFKASDGGRFDILKESKGNYPKWTPAGV